MSILLKRILQPYMAPAGDADGGGGMVDKGDDFVPTGNDAPEPVAKTPEPAAADADDADDLDPEDPDADPAGEAPASDAPKKKDQRIPLSRHKDILAKEREQRQALEARLAQYEKGTEVAAVNADITALENEIIGKEKEYTRLLADGEIDKAAALMREIRVADRQITEAKSEMRVQASIAQTTEQVRYDSALERIETAYDQLNPDSDAFDKEALAEVVEMKVFYERMRNMTPTKALQAAVKKILGAEDRSQTSATEVAPRVTKEDVAAARKKEAVAKTAGAVSRTPANFSKVGIDSNKAGGALNAADVMKMSQEDFKKLPDDVLARMRGDEFA